MSRKQDQLLVEAYERIVRGEPKLDERLGVHILKNPKGTYSFKGSIPVELGWVNKDGSELNPEQAKEVARANTPAMLAKARVFKTSKEAKSAAKKYKVNVTSIDEAKKREFTASLAKWATQRAKDVAKGVKFLEDAVKKKSANDILASISGIESHLGEMKKSMATVSEQELLLNEGKKRYRERSIGTAKHTVSFHDGKKTHKDGSDFFDIKIFKNKKDKATFIKELKKDGYLSESIGMMIGTPLSRRRDATPAPQMDEAKWSNDPFGYKRELADRLKDVARYVDGIHVSDRYYSGVDHDKKLKARVDKAFTAITKAVDNLEKVMNQNKGI